MSAWLSADNRQTEMCTILSDSFEKDNLISVCVGAESTISSHLPINGQ